MESRTRCDRCDCPVAVGQCVCADCIEECFGGWFDTD
jgi:hypothetical protein